MLSKFNHSQARHDLLTIKEIYFAIINADDFTQACSKLNVYTAMKLRLHDLLYLYKTQIAQSYKESYTKIMSTYQGEELSKKLSQFNNEITCENIDDIYAMEPFVVFKNLPKEVITLVWGDLTLGNAIDLKQPQSFLIKSSTFKEATLQASITDKKVIDIISMIQKLKSPEKFFLILEDKNKMYIKDTLKQLVSLYKLNNSKMNYFDVLQKMSLEEARQLFGEITLKQAISINKVDLSGTLSQLSFSPKIQLNLSATNNISTILSELTSKINQKSNIKTTQSSSTIAEINFDTIAIEDFVNLDYANDTMLLEQQETTNAELPSLPVTLPTSPFIMPNQEEDLLLIVNYLKQVEVDHIDPCVVQIDYGTILNVVKNASMASSFKNKILICPNLSAIMQHEGETILHLEQLQLQLLIITKFLSGLNAADLPAHFRCLIEVAPNQFAGLNMEFNLQDKVLSISYLNLSSEGKDYDEFTFKTITTTLKAYFPHMTIAPNYYISDNMLTQLACIPMMLEWCGLGSAIPTVSGATPEATPYLEIEKGIPYFFHCLENIDAMRQKQSDVLAGKFAINKSITTILALQGLNSSSPKRPRHMLDNDSAPELTKRLMRWK